jgi:hypothetical protein
LIVRLDQHQPVAADLLVKGLVKQLERLVPQVDRSRLPRARLRRADPLADTPHFLLLPDFTVSMVSDSLRDTLGVKLQEFRRHWTESLEVADPAALHDEFLHAQATHEGFSDRVHWRLRDGRLLGSTLQILPRRFHDQFVGFTARVMFDHAA